jgi:hypothetical protein
MRLFVGAHFAVALFQALDFLPLFFRELVRVRRAGDVLTAGRPVGHANRALNCSYRRVYASDHRTYLGGDPVAIRRHRDQRGIARI